MAAINHKHYMRIAQIIASASYCKRLQVGAVIVTEDGVMIPGYNGTANGGENCCEDKYGFTKRDVRHAELNSLLKLASSTLSGKGARMYITHSPCINCAQLIKGLGIKEVYFRQHYRSNEGVKNLKEQNIRVKQIN